MTGPLLHSLSEILAPLHWPFIIGGSIAAYFGICVGIARAISLGSRNQPDTEPETEDQDDDVVPMLEQPPVPAPEPVESFGVRDTLWWVGTADDQGVVMLSVVPRGSGLGVLVGVDDDPANGVRLDREDVQSLRHALTGWLVKTAETVQ